MDVRDLLWQLATAAALLVAVGLLAFVALVAIAHVRLWWWRRQFQRTRERHGRTRRDELEWQISMARGSQRQALGPVAWLTALVTAAVFLVLLVGALWWVVHVWLLPLAVTR